MCVVVWVYRCVRVRVRIYIYIYIHCVVNHCRNMILGSTCACSGAEDCPSVLQQVADVCPLSEGHTLFTSSGVQCQRLSVGKCEGAHMHTHIHVPVHVCTVCVIKKLTHARIYDKHCMHNGLCVHAQNMWLDKCLCLWFVSLCADLHRRITSGTVSREAQ